KNSELLKAEAEKNSLRYMAVSALTGENITELIKSVAELVRISPKVSPSDNSDSLFPLNGEAFSGELITITPRKRKNNFVSIIKQADGSFRVEHENFEKSVARINFEHEDALQKFSRLLKALNVEEALELAGAKEGDKVYIGDVEFDFEPEIVT
ncbi:MAG: Obg family GTPase CgtA, partial [Synergistaceae bacterium]|nr:Obg family GTPase CgtA [Synergistaceae bacterium]